MAINASSLINSYFGAGNSLLSEETRRKLIALGIDPSTVTSEGQAQIIIQNAQKARKAEIENLPKQPEKVCSGSVSSEIELMKKAKELATKMGLNLQGNLTLDEILKTISEEINTVLNSEYTDKSKRDLYKQYNTELGAIEQSYKVTKENENAVIMSMNMSANINKMILGL